jgi:hypothetical protein
MDMIDDVLFVVLYMLVICCVPILWSLIVGMACGSDLMCLRFIFFHSFE